MNEQKALEIIWGAYCDSDNEEFFSEKEFLKLCRDGGLKAEVCRAPMALFGTRFYIPMGGYYFTVDIGRWGSFYGIQVEKHLNGTSYGSKLLISELNEVEDYENYYL